MTLTNESATPPVEEAIAIVRGELSSRRRWAYRATLLGASCMLALIVSLWVTEPRPLPTRLHIALASMSLVAVGWIGVLTWILTRRNCPSAVDRIATAWMAMFACTLFLVVSLAVCVAKADEGAALNVGLLGAALVLAAVVILRGAYAKRTLLQLKLSELGQRPDRASER